MAIYDNKTTIKLNYFMLKQSIHEKYFFFYWNDFVFAVQHDWNILYFRKLLSFIETRFNKNNSYRYMRRKSYILKYNIKTFSQYVYRRSKSEQLYYKVHKLHKFLIIIENTRRQFWIKKRKLKIVEHWILTNGKWKIHELFSLGITERKTIRYILYQGGNGGFRTLGSHWIPRIPIVLRIRIFFVSRISVFLWRCAQYLPTFTVSWRCSNTSSFTAKKVTASSLEI